MSKRGTILSITSLIIWLTATLHAQQPAPENEFFVMFSGGAVELPTGKAEARLDELLITNPGIRNALQRGNAEKISRAFANFNLADTLGVGRTGEVVRLANLSNIYKVRLPQGATISETIRDLSALPEVLFAEPNGQVELDSTPNDTK